jgi:hypothetical protein
MGVPEIEEFLTPLAVERNVSPSTQNQAFNALLFLYYIVQRFVIPAKAGIHNLLIFLDSRVRGNDGLTNTIFL